DVTTLTFLKDKSPQSSIMFVCNKVDIEVTGPVHDDDDDEDEEEDNESDGSSESDEINDKKDKEEVVFDQLKDSNFLTGESSKTCDLFHAISAKDIRTERKDKVSGGEATRRFQRFQGKLQTLLADIMKGQTKRVVQALLVLQESFVNVVQVQRSQITQQASIIPEITRQACQIESKMFDSLKSFTSSDSEGTKQRIQEHLKELKETFSQDAVTYKVPNQRTIRERAQTMIKTDLKVAFSPEQLSRMNKEDFILERFLGDMKANILEKLCNSLVRFVQSLMEEVVSDLIEDIIGLNDNLTHPMVSKILEESYGGQFVKAKTETRELIEDILNNLLDSIKEAARVALRREISVPLSSKEVRTYSKRDVTDKTRRQSVVESLLATIDDKRVAEAVFDACFDCLQRMRNRFLSSMDFLQHLQTAFSNSQATVQLEDLRLRFTPEIRMLAVEGMALKYVQNYGPVKCGSPIAQTRHGQLFDCASVTWCRCSPRGQCVVKEIERKTVGESVWKQNAVDLVNMMDMIHKLNGSHPNLLRLYGWVFPEPDVLHVVMEKAEKSLLCALKELASAYAQSSLTKLIRRINMARDVAEGLKAIHAIGYIHEDIKPGNILVMSDGTAKINLAKPESPYDMTTLGAPFHVSPEMYQYHGKGHLSYLSYDIYAFGMLLWVLLEGRGTSRPKVYKDLETIQAMQAAVENGTLPCEDDKEFQIPLVSDACWSLMTKCWKDRASMKMDSIITDLKAIWEIATSFH
ncbi:Dual serine/threonine and tyrosine protein kinase, partial [Stylophora pistillata]